MAAPFRSSRRQPAVFGGGDGARSLLRLGAAARGADGAGPGRGPGSEVVLCLQPPTYRARDRVLQCRRGGDGDADGSHCPAQPPVDTEGDDRSVPGQGHHLAACPGPAGTAGFHADRPMGSISSCRSASPIGAATRSCTPTSPPGSRQSASYAPDTSRVRGAPARRRTPAPRSPRCRPDCGN